MLITKLTPFQALCWVLNTNNLLCNQQPFEGGYYRYARFAEEETEVLRGLPAKGHPATQGRYQDVNRLQSGGRGQGLLC